MRYLRIIMLGTLVLLLAPATSLAATPAQISYAVAKELVGGPFVHGPNVQVYVSVRYNKKRKPQVITDCAYAPKPAPVGLYIFTRNQAKIYNCSWQQFYGPKVRVTRAIRRNAAQRGCRPVRTAAKKGQRGRERVHISCRGLQSCDCTGGRTVLRYGSGPYREVILTSDARLIRRTFRGFEKTNYNRQL